MAQTQKSAPHAPQQTGYTIRKKDRNWMVVDPAGQLVCITVYRKGALEVVRRLAG